MDTTDLWERLGSIEDDQAYQVLTQLFARYEKYQQQNPADPQAEAFFQALAMIITQVQSCNLNRR